MKYIHGIPVWGDPIDYEALQQIERCAVNADAAAMMADHHVGYAVPIGGVVAYENKVSPSGVGYDIACGNKAVLTDMPGAEARERKEILMDAIWHSLAFGIGQKNDERVDHELFDDPTWQLPIIKNLKELAASQLGTIGSGNHYVDLLTDEQDRVWIGCHFGSRGFGHKTATAFLRAGGAKDGMHVEPLLLGVNTPLGEDYIAAMTLAGRYAYAGRDWVCARVARILGAHILEEVHNHHNFAWREHHQTQDLWVVRKGATPAWPGQKGFVGGSMGDDAVIVEGLDTEESVLALHSTVHGAGRVMGRKQAKRTVLREDMLAWIRERGVELRGAGVDESPQAYKRLPDVLAHHAGSIRVLHTLTPVGVAMAGNHERDPYKD